MTGEMSNQRDWIRALVLVTATFLAYQSAWNGQPVWDDDAHMTSPALRSLEGLARIWIKPGATQQYYPMVHMLFWLEYRLLGDAPSIPHVVSILLHSLSALLFIAILKQLEIPGAWLAGAIFALHPVHVESVAWISELKNTLSGAFYLSSAFVYLRFDRTRDRKLYAAALALFLLGLLSKSVVATLPAALLVVLWWQRGNLSLRRDIAPLTPFLAAGLSSGLFTAWIEYQFMGAHGNDFTFTIVERFLIAGRAICFYLGKLFWPADLIFMYPRWPVSQSVWWQYLYPAATLLLFAAALTLIFRQGRRGPLAALLLFAGTLVPVLGFVNVYPFRFSFVADHFQYLASLGIIALGAAALRAGGRLPGLALLAILAVLTWRQAAVYADVETLWRATLAGNPDSWLAHNNLGAVLYQNQRLEEARAHYQKALDLNPDFALARSNLGVILLTAGNPEAAMREFDLALRIDPNLAETHNKLCFALLQTGGVAEALRECTRALEIKPDLAEARNNLANALLQTGRAEEAVAHYQKALELAPEAPETHYNLGNAFGQAGRIEAAIGQFQKALAINPNYVKAEANLAWALATSDNPAFRDGSRAIALAERANMLSGGGDPAILITLAAAYAEGGRFEDAAETAKKTIGLAESSGEKLLAMQIAKQLKRYQARRPFHQ